MPQAVDGLVAGSLDDPGTGEIRHSGDAPLVNGGGKGLLRRLLREVEVANNTDQGGDDPAPIGVVDSFNRGGGSIGHTRL